MLADRERSFWLRVTLAVLGLVGLLLNLNLFRFGMSNVQTTFVHELEVNVQMIQTVNVERYSTGRCKSASKCFLSPLQQQHYKPRYGGKQEPGWTWMDMSVPSSNGLPLRELCGYRLPF